MSRQKKTDDLTAAEDAAATAPDELAQLAAENPAPAESELPSDAATPEEAPKVPTKVIVQMAITPIFAVMLPNWKVTSDEIAQLSDAYAVVLDKYFPDGLSAAPEFTALAVTAMVFAPRIMAKIPPKAPKPEPKAEPAQPAPAP